MEVFTFMGQKREKTKYPNIYYNTDTKKYDVKYNYKVYNAIKQKNEYKAKWVYNCPTIATAREELAKMQTNADVLEDKDITLEGIFDLWNVKAKAMSYSPVSIGNTKQQMNMIYQFLPKETKLKNITEDVYYKFANDVRDHGYSDETIHSINATFRKMINFAYKKKLISQNVLHTADNIKTKQKDDYRVIPNEEFKQIDQYFAKNKFVRLGVNRYEKYRFLVNLLYYTGIRIGECLALTYDDFEEFNYYKKGEEPFIRLVPSSKDIEGMNLRGMRVNVVKAYVSAIKLTKEPKNVKHRKIPLPYDIEYMFMKLRAKHLDNGGKMEDKLFDIGHGAVDNVLETATNKLGLPNYNCHEFRHTYISNLISKGVPLPVVSKVSGDTQETILKRYSHMFESDERMVLQAMASL